MDGKKKFSGGWRGISEVFSEGGRKTNLCFPVGGRASHTCIFNFCGCLLPEATAHFQQSAKPILKQFRFSNTLSLRPRFVHCIV